MMSTDRSEFRLIDWIRTQVRDRDPVKLGIGDDAAVLQMLSGRETLVAADMLMEGVHFSFPNASPELVGRKALAVNLSDIAAMGGRALAAFVSVALPVERGMSFAKDVHKGLLKLADEFDVIVSGGDTNSWRGPLVVNVAVIGECLRDRAVVRSGAKPGDIVFVTGDLGGSISGHHLTFTPRLRESASLVQHVEVNSMMDISDGLAADLHHILQSSGVGAVLDAESIPISSAARNMYGNENALRHALSDGEDFELLFTVTSEAGSRLEEVWNEITPITRIGRITEGPDCLIRQSNGDVTVLPAMGWTHSI